MFTIGCHLSIAKGFAAAARDAGSIGANTFQFFTIPIGLFVGGFMVDKVCEPFMGSVSNFV